MGDIQGLPGALAGAKWAVFLGAWWVPIAMGWGVVGAVISE